MKKVTTTAVIAITAILALSLATPVLAGHKDRHEHRHKNKFFDYARVIEVQPVYKQVKVSLPRTECWDEHRRRPVTREVHNGNTSENMIVGGIIGGVIGHQLGGGSGKDAATLAGTLIGAAVGHDNSRRTVQTGEYRIEHRERCETHVDYRLEERQDGYRVTYRYHGEVFHTRMAQHPGKRIRIKVQITPVVY